MKFRDNFSFRMLDFAYPREAAKAIYELDIKYIDDGVETQSMVSGPMPMGDMRYSGTMSRRIFLIDEAHADRYIAELKAVVKPFETKADDDYGTHYMRSNGGGRRNQKVKL
jgi:hypothetical protein